MVVERRKEAGRARGADNKDSVEEDRTEQQSPSKEILRMN